MRAAAEVALLTLGGVAVVLLGALLAARVGRDLVETRRQRRSTEIRRMLLRWLLDTEGMPGDRAQLVEAGRGRSGRVLEEHAFRLLAKVDGEVRAQLVTLLTVRHADRRAMALARSVWSVRRCRGAHRLGLIGHAEAAPILRSLLADGDPLVRRVAVRSLGQVRDEGSVPALVALVVGEVALARDALAAVVAVGPDATPSLEQVLGDWLEGRMPASAGAFSARALGALGSVRSVPLLVRAVGSGDQDVVPAAAAALGRIGSREAVTALQATLSSRSEAVRTAAATALGDIGDPGASAALGAALDGRSGTSDRAVAAALLRLGRPGRSVLGEHLSPYAREALAVAEIRAAA
ncbi:HEAT repeat domain-containing protein [Aeromicrobium sp. CF3.5]|uniref:HEAT repeat domain-containing protein n=1 Tax=Aeromicrobium sp. CF3.5 TaxID=3373078 RepID=UPI003EE765A8